MKRSISFVMLMMRLGLLLATTVCFGQSYTVTDQGTLPGDSRSCGYGINECGPAVGISWGDTYPSVPPFLSPDALRAGIPLKGFSVVTPEDIEKLCQVAIERGERPGHEGHLFLEFKSDGFRQYVTLTLARGLYGSCVAVERIDFIQEQWQINVLHQDQIDQWVVSANASGTARYVWHKHLLEDKGAVLNEEFLPIDEHRAKAIVEKITARFLPANRVPSMLSVTAIMPSADRSRKHAADKWLAESFLALNWGVVRRSKIWNWNLKNSILVHRLIESSASLKSQIFNPKCSPAAASLLPRTLPRAQSG